MTPYVATAVKHMAATLAVEWAKSGVRVNTLRLVVYSLAADGP